MFPKAEVVLLVLVVLRPGDLVLRHRERLGYTPGTSCGPWSVNPRVVVSFGCGHRECPVGQFGVKSARVQVSWASRLAAGQSAGDVSTDAVAGAVVEQFLTPVVALRGALIVVVGPALDLVGAGVRPRQGVGD
jgi:hypothetical protein